MGGGVGAFDFQQAVAIDQAVGGCAAIGDDRVEYQAGFADVAAGFEQVHGAGFGFQFGAALHFAAAVAFGGAAAQALTDDFGLVVAVGGGVAFGDDVFHAAGGYFAAAGGKPFFGALLHGVS